MKHKLHLRLIKHVLKFDQTKWLLRSEHTKFRPGSTFQINCSINAEVKISKEFKMQSLSDLFPGF